MSGPDGQARGVPDSCEPYLANLAQVWHWPLADLDRLTVPRLMHWHALAVERNPPQK